MKKYLKEEKPIFVFAPTIEECERTFMLLNVVFKGGNYVHSKRKDREKIIENFRQNRYPFLVTTSVLERGVTVKNLQVIVFHAENTVYDKGTLIQIAGRAGRKADAPTGDVYFLAESITEPMRRAKEEIMKANEVYRNEDTT